MESDLTVQHLFPRLPACIIQISNSFLARMTLTSISIDCAPVATMSTSSSDIKDHCDVERAENPLYLDRMTTAGGHVDDRSQPALPVVHRSLANPAPLGFLSFATGRPSTPRAFHQNE